MSTSAAPRNIDVDTTRGPVRGERRTHSVRFLGIPYAKPPVGRLRFAAPEPPDPWREPRDATVYGPTAQRRASEATLIPEPTISGKGTLNLNVFTPDPSPDAGLPVLVWIHGGGYVAGSAASPWYDGRTFNRDGVILVSIGYRLGIEGFLRLEDAPDNRGVRDWIAALRWVQENIAAFGGDPAKVTVGGQSVGGSAVQTLLATPSAGGLFRAAISASGAVMLHQDSSEGRAVAELFTRRTGVPATAAALRDLSDQQLLDHQDALCAPEPDLDGPGTHALRLAPFADGQLVPVPVLDALTDAWPAHPLLLGFTRDEFDFLPVPRPPDTPSLTDLLFRRPGLAIAEARARHGLPTWLYQFDWSSEESPAPGLAFHWLDLPFAFDLLDAEGVIEVTGPNPPQSLADAIHSAWVRFVHDLDPGPDWPRFTLDNRPMMRWGPTPHVVSDHYSDHQGT
ncbi:carboxylesterase/lipase family protein [Streptomyces sp. YGL11-2]|uniref:carboxylesterase/lipase family protein n=1 Tax=Streptomyces sp. YGL11-2 TaxID=3414028 RepID=UPI003CF55247